MVKANHITSLSASQKNTANPAIQSAMEAVSAMIAGDDERSAAALPLRSQ
jgi:hypothetical protein